MAISGYKRLTLQIALLFAAFSTVFLVPAFAETGHGTDPASREMRLRKSGRPPVIIIPGLTGSELFNKETGARVWFSLRRTKGDDLRLPISPDLAANADGLIPGDILRKIQIIRFTPEIDVYQSLIDSLVRDGYREGKMDEPPETGFADTFYVFAYDWRRDNTENARLLVEKMERLRKQLDHPELRFDIIAHSMGGLIARYATMYRNSDLSKNRQRPDWKNAVYFNSISMIGTPNGGSMESLNSLINGFGLFGAGKTNIPFILHMSKFDLFTLPSIFQLIPADGTLRAFDKDLRPLKIDVFDPSVWEEYGWTAYSDRKFGDEFSSAEQKIARTYFRAVLDRARLFHLALNADRGKKTPVPLHYLGAECKRTLDGVILFEDQLLKRWDAIFDVDDFIKRSGNRFSKAEVEKLLYAPGDGVVAKGSLIFATEKNATSKIVCDDHNRLTGNNEINQDILGILNSSGGGEDKKPIKAGSMH